MNALAFLLILGFLCDCGGRKAEIKELRIQLGKDTEFLRLHRENNESAFIDQCYSEESSGECGKRVVKDRETRAYVEQLIIRDIAESKRKIAELEQELANENGNVTDR
jgi:hypothetical protein